MCSFHHCPSLAFRSRARLMLGRRLTPGRRLMPGLRLMESSRSWQYSSSTIHSSHYNSSNSSRPTTCGEPHRPLRGHMNWLQQQQQRMAAAAAAAAAQGCRCRTVSLCHIRTAALPASNIVAAVCHLQHPMQALLTQVWFMPHRGVCVCGGGTLWLWCWCVCGGGTLWLWCCWQAAVNDHHKHPTQQQVLHVGLRLHSGHRCYASYSTSSHLTLHSFF